MTKLPHSLLLHKNKIKIKGFLTMEAETARINLDLIRV